MIELWEVADREHEPPRFGWLATGLPNYPRPEEIKCRTHFRNDFHRPLIELEPTDYPLAIDQRDGITLEQVKAIAMAQHGQSLMASV